MKVKCIINYGADLTLDKTYNVNEDESYGECYTVADDKGRRRLYLKFRFREIF